MALASLTGRLKLQMQLSTPDQVTFREYTASNIQKNQTWKIGSRAFTRSMRPSGIDGVWGIPGGFTAWNSPESLLKPLPRIFSEGKGLGIGPSAAGLPGLSSS